MLAADTLTELIKDNEEIVDLIERDGLVEKFLSLMSSIGRNSHYVRSLTVMCESRGKAVRPNQWRVAHLLFDEEDLLPRLQVVVVVGSAASPAGGSSSSRIVLPRLQVWGQRAVGRRRQLVISGK